MLISLCSTYFITYLFLIYKSLLSGNWQPNCLVLAAPDVRDMRPTWTSAVTARLLLVAMVTASSPHHRQSVSSSSLSTLSRDRSSPWWSSPQRPASLWDLRYPYARLFGVESVLERKTNEKTVDDATSDISPQNVVRLQTLVSPSMLVCHTDRHSVADPRGKGGGRRGRSP